MSIATPTINQCLAHMEQYEMLDNIRDHSFRVARVAELLVNSISDLQRPDVPAPDQQLVISGALLHDIAKTPCLKKGCRHAETGAAICRDLGYPEIAEIVAEHVILKDFSETRYRAHCFNAKELVYYADKRVRHDQIVSLDERLAYIIERYGENNPERHHLIRINFECTRILEKYLFQLLPFSADEVAAKISSAPFVHHNCPLDRNVNS